MPATVTPGHTFTSAEVVTPSKLNQLGSGTVSDATPSAAGVVTRSALGQTVMDATDGNAALSLLGVNTGAALHTTTKGLTIQDTAASVEEIIGQDAGHGLALVWNYNATPANASAVVATFGKSNDLYLQAKNLYVDVPFLAGLIQCFAGGRVRIGGGADTALHVFQVNGGMSTTGNAALGAALSVAGNTALGGDASVAGNATVAGNLTVTGTLTASSLELGTMSTQNANNVTITGGNITATMHHVNTVAGAPSILMGPALGAGSVSITGNDSRGVITLTQGTSGSINAVACTVTFATAYAGMTAVVISPRDSTSIAIMVDGFVTSSTTAFTINIAGSALTNGATYSVNYIVMG